MSESAAKPEETTNQTTPPAGDESNAAAAAAAVPGEEAPVDDTDAEIEAMRQRVREMEEEQKKMNEISGGGSAAGGLQHAPSNATGSGAAKQSLTAEQIADIDSRSIHVAQVDYTVTEEELKQLFEACGAVNRATILKDKFTGQPKGFAYIEFASSEAIQNAMILNDTDYKGRILKITPKRTNNPGFNRGGRGGRGGYAPRGGFRGRGGYDGYGPVRGRGGRGGRGRGGYHPYGGGYQY